MLVPGLVAFGIYRLLKGVFPLSSPVLLLLLSGGLSSLSALWAYRVGRGVSLQTAVHEDGFARLRWLVGWVGLGYGILLSLLVLALLKLFVNYDFLLHPEGPAMMALIIACTAVTRDAFEIGHLRRLEKGGESVMTFPDGKAFWQMVKMNHTPIRWWALVGTIIGISTSLVMSLFHTFTQLEWIGPLVVGTMAACFAYGAFLAGERQQEHWSDRFQHAGWFELGRFWIWPCLTFAVTYYLVQVGIVTYVFQLDLSQGFVQVCIGGITTGLLTAYCYYLGNRKFVECQDQQDIPENLKACPFVMEMLTKVGVVKSGLVSTQTATGSSEGNCV